MLFKRQIHLQHLALSAFIFGPRMTGKTHLLRQLKNTTYFDLLDPVVELKFKQEPQYFWEQINALEDEAHVIVDEIQKVPALLDYVQKGIEKKGLQFILSGSSARKLKQGRANLLGGRALDLKLHPLTSEEMGGHFNLDKIIKYGSLPKIAQLVLDNKIEDAKGLLRSYYTTYIKEEIQAEALTRNIGSFQRFLNVAAQSNGCIIEYVNISRECAVPMSTVKEYYLILEDTLLGFYLWPWDRSERKKARPKFYFFDTGVVRAIQDRLNDNPTPIDKGILFEQWFVNELRRLRDYHHKECDFSFFRKGDYEVDVLVTKSGKPVLAFECKTGKEVPSTAALKAFQKEFPNVSVIVVSAQEKIPRKLDNKLEILPVPQALKKFLAI